MTGTVDGVSAVPRITKVDLVDDYKLRLSFKDGLVGGVDLSYLVGPDAGPIFVPLRDLEFFRRVRLDRTVGTIVWPNGADVAPETLYEHARQNKVISSATP